MVIFCFNFGKSLLTEGQALSQALPPANIRVTEVFENLAEWIKQQYKIGNLPQFPPECTIEKIVVNNGTISGQDAKGVEFSIVINIIYTKKGDRQ